MINVSQHIIYANCIYDSSWGHGCELIFQSLTSEKSEIINANSPAELIELGQDLDKFV